MPIFRGDGGSGDSNTDATITVVTQQAIIATNKASEAAASASGASSSATAAGNSATAAAASASGVQGNASAAQASANAAATSASGASTSATTASNSATASGNSASGASTSATNSGNSATASAASASTATTKASNASTSASNASTSATTAASKVVLATAQVALATTQATNAGNSATSAANSVSAVATSATNASNSATASANSATAGANSATASANSATAAANSAASIGANPSFTSVTVTGTTAVKMSAGTTAQRPSGVAGQFRYNSTLGKFEGYSTAWGEIGGGSAADFKLNSFTGNGSTVAYTLSSNPVEDNTLVYIDGVYQNKTSYAIVGNVLTFSAAPPNSSAIEITAATIAPVEASTEFKLSQFAGNGSTVAFTLSAQSPENNTNVYIDGVYQSKSNYSVSGTTLTFSTAPPNGSAVEVMAAHAVVVSVSTPDDNTVTTAKIVNNAVTTAKIADANVTTAKIADGAITAAKLASVPISVGITTTVTASSLTATVNTHVYVSAAGKTITLPASPTIGQRVIVTVGNFVNTVVGRNGSKIMSLDANFTMDAAYLSIQFIYTDAVQGWVMS